MLLNVNSLITSVKHSIIIALCVESKKNKSEKIKYQIKLKLADFLVYKWKRRYRNILWRGIYDVTVQSRQNLSAVVMV
jgi:hypothetical protein